MDGAKVARRMWGLFEPIHAVTYFAPESRDAYRDAGMKGYWMGYFAGRSAAMGAVQPAVVEATFYNFAPWLVRRAIPDAWRFADPSQVLDARLVGVDRSLRQVLGAEMASIDLASVVELLKKAVEGASFEGRALAAANAALDWPTEPLLALWHATTILREHRGDGHVASLCVAGLDGCQAHVSLVSTGVADRSTLQPNRGWTDEEWGAADRSLVDRGWIDGSGRATESGRSARREIEETTDRLAARPWEHLGEEDCNRLADLLRPIAKAVSISGIVPVPNPIGLPPLS